jgi:hypothetical protein
MADALVSKTNGGKLREGSTPSPGTDPRIYSPYANPILEPRVNKKRIILSLSVFFIAGTVLVVVILLFSRTKSPTRDANKYELSYQTIASNTGNPTLCYKISPNALDNGAPWSPRGIQISYTRSDCFLKTALNSKNSSLCSEVKPISTLILDGSDYNPEECRRMVATNGNTTWGAGYFGPDGPRWLLEELGYTDDMIPVSMKENWRYNSTQYWFDYYSEINNSSEFQEKTKSLPDFSNQ